MLSDEELMLRYRQGEREAFRSLFERYAPLLHRVVSRDLRDPARVDDLVQQTFLQVHRARFDYDAAQPFRPWIFTIALNLKRETLRTRARRGELSGYPDGREPSVPPAGQHRVEARRTVAWALERLPGDQREVIELHWFQGLSFAEVARCLGIGAVAAKVRAHRGYSSLRALLSGNQMQGRGI